MYQQFEQPREWTKWVLGAAGLYNLALAALALFSPAVLLRYLAPGHAPAAGLEREFLGAVALLTAVLGVAFWLAAGDAYRHWPVVFTGFLAKFTVGIGLGHAIWQHRVDAAAWVIVILDNLVWVLLLAAILHGAHESLLRLRRTVSPEVLRFALRRKSQYGITLEEHTRLTPVLLVFLRHTGCMFCREALSDLAERQVEIEDEGARLVLVHMGHESEAADFFALYGLENVPRISDPDRALYRAFALNRAGFSDLFGPKVWLRAVSAAIIGHHWMGRPAGDSFQMPGAFLLFHGEIVRSYRHQSPADRPDYLDLVTGRAYAAPELRNR